jgi:2-oxoacid:acceptor oxidoreductase delta subunit (pyruvate/2-ketoisovalerate family)
MPELRPWQDLPVGGVVIRDDAEQPETGGWRTGTKPHVELDRCVNCLLCWLYCPDSAVVLDGTTLVGFDERYCKGCEICAEICPVNAIEMVADEN